MNTLHARAPLPQLTPQRHTRSRAGEVDTPGQRPAHHKDLYAVCRLAPPWAFFAGARLTGLDVIAVEQYAALRGSRVQWQVVEHDKVADALRSSRASIGVGGLSDTLHREPGLHLLRASSRHFSGGEPRHGTPECHVWALGCSTLIDRWSLRMFLLWKRIQAGSRGW